VNFLQFFFKNLSIIFAEKFTTMKKQIFTLTSILIASLSLAQNIGINATGVIPNSDAGLDVNFSNKGVLIPRVSLNNLTTFNPPITTNGKTNSLLIFNTNSSIGQGYYYWDSINNKWIKLVTTGGSPSDAWLTLGNAGTTPGTHFIGTTDNVDLVFKTNNTQRMLLTNTGRLGINTTPASYYLDVLSNNSSIDGIRGQHTSGTTTSAFAAVTGSVSNGAYTSATGYLGYHNSNNKTFAVYGNGGDLAGMFNGKVGINSVSTNLTNYDLEVRNNLATNPSNVLIRATAQKTNINDVLANLDFGDNYTSTAQAKIQVLRDAAASTSSDLPTALTFHTTSDNSNTPQERMRINNQGQVGIGTNSPVSPAVLDVTSTNKGVIFPRIALSGATDNITVPSPIDGIMIYNTSTAGTGTNAITPGYYYWQNNRWNKFQTNGYAGVVFGVHTSTTPNHLSAVAPSWQYMGSYIDLPPGKWVVYIYELISPNNGGVNNWDVSSNAALWVRCSLSNSNSSFSYSPDIIGSKLASGSVVAPCIYGMVAGAIYVYNSSGATKRYYLWANMNQYNTACGAFNFATTAWGENQFFAIPAE